MSIIFRWDLDKTYLKTEFSTAKDLIKTFFQKAEDKKVFAGATALIQALDNLPESHTTFISGSPRPMRKVLEKKLELDGVHIDSLTLKPNFSNALRGRFRALKEQVGYKLPALLEQRLLIEPGAKEICFGDDAEADAFIYSLYGDVIVGVISPNRLKRIMTLAGSYEDQIDQALELYVEIKKRNERVNPIESIFIHLEGRSGPKRFDVYGQRVVPIYNYFQAALVLYTQTRLDMDTLLALTQNILAHPRLNEKRLANSAQDLVRRNHIPPDLIRACLEAASTIADKELIQCFQRAEKRSEELSRENIRIQTAEKVNIPYERVLEESRLAR